MIFTNYYTSRVDRREPAIPRAVKRRRRSARGRFRSDVVHTQFGRILSPRRRESSPVCAARARELTGVCVLRRPAHSAGHRAQPGPHRCAADRAGPDITAANRGARRSGVGGEREGRPARPSWALSHCEPARRGNVRRAPTSRRRRSWAIGEFGGHPILVSFPQPDTSRNASVAST